MNLHRSSSSPSHSLAERGVRLFLWACTLVSVVTTAGILFVLLKEVFLFFQLVPVTEFLFGTVWTPLFDPRSFGVLPLVSGTLLIGLGAVFIAAPVGAMAALFLSEYLDGSPRIILKSIIEILAGIPSVVYGFFAITFITPHLRQYFESVEIFNALSAVIVVGVMIIPTVSSVSQDAFEAVPDELRRAAYGLGARKYQVAWTVVFPAALSGFVAAVILGFSRAIGETMAVTLAAGSTPKLGWNLFESMQTMTSYIVQVSLGDTPTGTIEYQSIFAVGLMLFVLTLGSNIVARMIVRRFQEKYS